MTDDTNEGYVGAQCGRVGRLKVDNKWRSGFVVGTDDSGQALPALLVCA